MARDWPRLVLATAVAVAMVGVPCVIAPAAAQSTEPGKASTPAKPTKSTKSTKKTAKKASDAEQNTDEQGQTRKKQDPAEAAKAIEAAQKMIEGGKADAAATSLTATLSAGNLPPGMMARALLYRGTANRQLQKPALAIQDLTQALWIKGGLTESDRAEALRQRSAAYADAGVGDSGTFASAGTASGNRTASNDAVTTGSNASAQSASSGSGWNIFGNLFGQSPASAPPPVPAPAPKIATPAPAAVSAWSSQTEVRPQAVAMAPPPASAAPAATPEGRFRIQLGLVRSENEANSLAARVGGELAGVFETRRASIDQTVVGNMGTMYRVRVGPYASAHEGQAVCGRLKGTGLDCLVVSQ